MKMAASATTLKDLNVLKQCCNPLNVSHSESSKENLGPLLGSMIKKVPNIQKGQRSVINVRKLLQTCLKVLEIKQFSLQVQNMI
jgi:hypothetical protein